MSHETDIDMEVDKFLRGKIRAALDSCTEPQRNLFDQIWHGGVDGVPRQDLKCALALCRRTIDKNQKEPESK